jgi:hypothetical protein
LGAPLRAKFSRQIRLQCLRREFFTLVVVHCVPTCRRWGEGNVS